MGLMDSWLNLYGEREKYKRMGILKAEDAFRRSRLSDASEKFQGLLGGTVTTQGSMRSAEDFDELGNPIWGQETLQAPRREGYGFLGSDRGHGARMALSGGMLGAGFSPSETNIVLGQLPTAQKPSVLQQQFEYMQSLPQAQQEQLMDFRRAGAQNINLNQGMPGRVLTTDEKVQNNLNPEATFQYDKNGMIKSVSKEQFSQPQILSGGFATRMNTATQDIESILGDKEFEPGGIIQNIEEFGIPSMIANFMRSPDGQKYRQAQENWITANLRKESGAAIPTAEIESERRKWFPMPGDSSGVVAQKRKSRKDAERAMKKASGGAFEDLEDQADREELEELRQLQGDL